MKKLISKLEELYQSIARMNEAKTKSEAELEKIYQITLRKEFETLLTNN